MVVVVGVLNQLPCNPNLGLDLIELGWKLGWVVTIITRPQHQATSARILFLLKEKVSNLQQLCVQGCHNLLFVYIVAPQALQYKLRTLISCLWVVSI